MVVVGGVKRVWGKTLYCMLHNKIMDDKTALNVKMLVAAMAGLKKCTDILEQ